MYNKLLFTDFVVMFTFGGLLGVFTFSYGLKHYKKHKKNTVNKNRIWRR